MFRDKAGVEAALKRKGLAYHSKVRQVKSIRDVRLPTNSFVQRRDQTFTSRSGPLFPKCSWRRWERVDGFLHACQPALYCLVDALAI